ncbi:hypothetical protein MBCUT_05920 [Methanobrevibacter cuticularis]|uniref:DUF927 domain-containing protein n=1 Tax=Methanobrevibacter cuticularis TaxID=47311 RepID=A0A166EJL9_9EURY|nr:hypothetical protein [Methanobrevibacter cuticularis]KZX16728.1 hypothetical protein MBCUT_05920 [Methanobrevibacter cuticularis]
MFNKISDLKEVWKKSIINLYPAADKGTPAVFATPEDGSYHNIGFSFSRIDEDAKKWLENREEKKFFSHAFFWDKSPFDSFEELIDISNGKLNDKDVAKPEGWCVLIGRGSNKEFLQKDDGGLRLACVDIDGYKTKDDTDDEIRKRSCDELYEAISENADFDFFAEKSQGGGYHLWYVTKQQVLTKQVYHLNNLKFPEDSEFEGLRINEISNTKDRNKEFIEVFSKGGVKYVSCSPTEKYTFVDDEPVELLKMKPVEDINAELKNAFVKAGFTYSLDTDSVDTTEEKPLKTDKESSKNSKRNYSYEKGDYDLDELQENILNCYREGNMNSFGYKLIANFRRAGYDTDEVYQIFKELPIEQNLAKISVDINQQYSVSYDTISGITGLQKAIDEFCIPEALDSTKEFFYNLFQKENADVVDNICNPIWEELSTDEMILEENKLFILYDGEYWIRQALKQKNPDEKCLEVLENIEEYNIDTLAYLVVMQDKMGYHYGWSHDLSFNITPNVFQKFLDESESNRNQYIGQATNYFSVTVCKNAVSLFLKHLKGRLGKDTKDNGISSAKEKLAHNSRNYDYIKYSEKARGISNDTLNKINLMNNLYVINDSIVKEMKVIEERSIAKSEFTLTGEQVKTDIYGERDIDLIGQFAFIGLTILEDVLGEKDVKEAEIISKEGFKKIKFDKTKKFIENIDNIIGVQGKTDTTKKAILGVMNFIIENKVNYEHGFYSSADGIFTHNNELCWFENNRVKEVERPTKDELNKAIEVLKKLFKHTSIQDKSKIATIFKWYLSAPFAYLIRDRQINGGYIKFFNLIGESDAGKTALCLICNLTWGKEGRRKGTDVSNAANLAAVLKVSSWPDLIDEADALLSDNELRPMIKSVRDRNSSRSKHEWIDGEWVQKEQLALSIAIFTSNTYYESTEKSEVKRVLNMSFGPEDVSLDKGKEFKELFNVSDNEGYKNSDFGAFEAFGREFFHQVKEKYQKEIFEDILNSFLESLSIEEVLLEYDDSENLNKNIDDMYRQAILDVIIKDFNYEDRYRGELPEDETLGNQKLQKSREPKFIRVVEEQRIPYLSMTSNNKYLRVTGKINKRLRKEGHKFDNMNIRTILNLFKEHNTGIDSDGKNIRYVNIPIEVLGL